MTLPTELVERLTRVGEDCYATGKADGRTQGASDRQAEVDDLQRRLAGLRAEYDAHMATHASPEVPDRGPLEYADLDAYLKANPKAPQDKTLYVPVAPGVDLESAAAALPSKEHILLIGRGQDVPLESVDGFRAAGVSAVRGQGGKKIPIANRYKGKPARTWFAMARVEHGIVGLSATSRVVPTDSGWTQEAQIPDKGSPLPGGGTSPGRARYDLAGNIVRRADGAEAELVGSQEKLVESVHPNPVFSNFTIVGRDFGGVAYSAISVEPKNGEAYLDRLGLDGAWRGFSAEPNGEAAAININGGRYLITRCSTSPLDTKGKRVGTSPIMLNRTTGGRIEVADYSQVLAGMLTYWKCSGVNDVVQTDAKWGGTGANLEDVADGFVLTWTGGAIWSNRDNKGGHPSPDGIWTSKLHLNIHAAGRVTVNLVDVDVDQSVVPGAVNVQLYGDSTDPAKVKITATRDGKPVDVAAFGKGGRVKLYI